MERNTNAKRDLWPLFILNYLHSLSTAASNIFFSVIKYLFFHMSNTIAVWTFLQTDGWFTLVWIRDDEHSNVIQIKNAFFFFYFAPIWCLTSLFQHGNHRGDQWCCWIKECAGWWKWWTEVWCFPSRQHWLLCLIWLHSHLSAVGVSSPGPRKLHVESSQRSGGRMLCVSDERALPSSSCRSALTLTAGTYITASLPPSLPPRPPFLLPVGAFHRSAGMFYSASSSTSLPP